MTKANFFFWGIVSDTEAEEMWKVLHDHFEKLASKDDDGKKEANYRRSCEAETFKGKAVNKNSSAQEPRR